MSTLKPGIYKATVRGVPDKILMVDNTGMGHASTIYGVHVGNHITDARPLIVLDLSDWHIPTALVDLRSNKRFPTFLCGLIADQIEAQTKPPRIEEPMERGAVVMTGGKYQFPYTRYSFSEGGPGNWIDENGITKRWDDLIDPVLVTS